MFYNFIQLFCLITFITIVSLLFIIFNSGVYKSDLKQLLLIV